MATMEAPPRLQVRLPGAPLIRVLCEWVGFVTAGLYPDHRHTL